MISSISSVMQKQRDFEKSIKKRTTIKGRDYDLVDVRRWKRDLDPVIYKLKKSSTKGFKVVTRVKGDYKAFALYQERF